jgi:hypothetical protein
MRALLWMLRIAQLAFGCRHSRLSGPFTINKRTYQVCPECGLEFPYSWELMRSVQATAAHDTDAPSTRAGHTEVSIA